MPLMTVHILSKRSNFFSMEASSRAALALLALPAAGALAFLGSCLAGGLRLGMTGLLLSLLECRLGKIRSLGSRVKVR